MLGAFFPGELTFLRILTLDSYLCSSIAHFLSMIVVEGLKDLKDKPTVSGNVENLNHLMDFDIEKPSPRPRKDSNVMEGIRYKSMLKNIKIIQYSYG